MYFWSVNFVIQAKKQQFDCASQSIIPLDVCQQIGKVEAFRGMKLIKGQRIVTMIITEERREMSKSKSKSKRRMRMTGTGMGTSTMGLMMWTSEPQTSINSICSEISGLIYMIYVVVLRNLYLYVFSGNCEFKSTENLCQIVRTKGYVPLRLVMERWDRNFEESYPFKKRSWMLGVYLSHYWPFAMRQAWQRAEPHRAGAPLGEARLGKLGPN